ncbi:MAG: XRE family transcriptional regulator [Chloroflexota bacterium]
MATTFEQAAHGQAARLPITAIARYLEDVLGQRLTAVVAGTTDAKAVSKWANGTRTPHPETERNLRHAYHVAQLLMQVEAAETVRAWFAGMNPDLDDVAPALLIATDPGRVVQAARAFLANG